MSQRVLEVRRLLETHPRVRLSVAPTPIHPMERLSARLGGLRAWVLRDDLTGFALGGNKVRKLDYLMGDALAGRVNAIVVPQASSFSRNTAAAGRTLGVDVHVLVAGKEAEHNPLSRAFFASARAYLHYVAEPARIDAEQSALVETLRADGRRVVEFHPGGSNEIGTLGYVEAFAEVAEFSAREDVRFDRIYHASGSAATQAGLVLGGALCGLDETQVLGVAVSQPAAVQARRVSDLATATAGLLGVAFDSSAVVVDDRHLGDGYPIPSAASRAAVDAFAKEEGLLLDPIYTGKAAAALLGHARDGELGEGANVLFLHTGGNAGLYY